MTETDHPDRTSQDPEDERREFARLALQEALTFMRRDNEIVTNLASIMGTLARHVEDNPRAALEFALGGQAHTPPGAELSEASSGGRNFWDFLLGDKEFILDLIKCLLG